MKKLFLWFSCLLLSVSVFSYKAEASEISDINGHWAEAVMRDWRSKDYISGYADGSVRPDNLVTRAEFFAMVNKPFGFIYSSPINFSDVRYGSWYYNIISTAVAAGYVSGYSDGTIQPDRYITREEAAVMLCKAVGLVPYEPGADIYKDSAISQWSRPYIGAISNAGIMQGYSDGTFRPLGTMTRAEAVTSINNGLMRRNQNIGSFVQPVENQQISSGLTVITPNTGTNTQSNSSSSNSQGWQDIEDFEVVISASSYGSSRDDKYINGNVRIDANSTTVRNTEITGDLLISSSSKGRVTLDKVSVSGTIYVEGKSRLVLSDSDVSDILVRSSNSDVILSAEGETTAGTVYLYSGAEISEGKLKKSYYGFEDIVIEDSVKNNSRFELSGDFNQIDIYASRIKFIFTSGTISSLNIEDTAERGTYDIHSGTTVDTVDIYGQNSSFSGRGRIKYANVYAKYAYFSVKPDTVYNDYDYDTGSGSVSYGDYNLTVYVEDEDGDDLEDARVTIKREGYSSEDWERTNSAGRAYFGDLYNDYYDITVEKSGYTTETKRVNVRYDDTEIRITLRESNYKKTIFTVFVTEVDTDGEYVFLPGAKVVLKVGTSTVEKITSAVGMVVFTDLDIGRYDITISKDGYESETGQILVSSNEADNLLTLALIKK